MHDRIHRVRSEQLVQGSAIRQIAHHQFGVFRHRETMAAAQVVEDNDLVPRLQQLFGHHAADVTRTPCNQNPHWLRAHAPGIASQTTWPTPSLAEQT